MTAGTVDLEIHGVALVRLVDAPEPLARKLQDRLTPVLTSSGLDQPDIVVEFPEEFGADTVHHIGQRFAAFSGQRFYILDRATGVTLAEIPFGAVGTETIVRCSRDATSVPLLFDLLRVVMFARGWISLHASAVVMEGTGVLLAGWPRGGKTGAMLALVAEGAHFVGDEWIFLSGDGRRMLGLPTSVAVSEWQLESLPGLIPTPGLQRKLMFWFIHRLESGHRLMTDKGMSRTFAAKSLGKSLPYLRSQLKVARSPQSLFGRDQCVFEGEPEKFFLLIGHDRPEIVIEPCAPETVASRMVMANRYEEKKLFDYYQAFLFAFPQARSEVLELSADHQAEMLSGALANKETFLVSHPYAGPLDRLGGRIIDCL